MCSSTRGLVLTKRYSSEILGEGTSTSIASVSSTFRQSRCGIRINSEKRLENALWYKTSQGPLIRARKTCFFLCSFVIRYPEPEKKKKKPKLCYIFLRAWTDSTGWVNLLKSKHFSYTDKNISRDCMTTQPSRYCDPGILANWVIMLGEPARQTKQATPLTGQQVTHCSGAVL